jgi:hypothetical protein
MADQILSVSFKVDAGSLEGDAAAAGKLAAKAFEQGFGALNLATPMAKSAKDAQEHAAAVGKALGAATQLGAEQQSGGGKGGEGGKALALGGLLGGLLPKNFGRDIAESADLGAKGLGTLRAAFAGIAEFVATGSFASASRSIQEVAQSAGETAEGFGSIGGAIAKATPYVAAFVGTAGAGAVATKELAEKGADAVLSMDALSKSSGLGLGQLLGWREAARHQGIDFDEFSRGLARMNVAQTTARAEIEKRATEEPLDVIDAQRRVVQAYRAREAAVDAVGGAEDKVIGARARAAALRVGGGEEAAITEERGPLSVSGARIAAWQADLDVRNAKRASEGYGYMAGAVPEQVQINLAAAEQRSDEADLQERQAENQERERIAAQRAGAGPGGAGTLTPRAGAAADPPRSQPDLERSVGGGRERPGRRPRHYPGARRAQHLASTADHRRGGDDPQPRPETRGCLAGPAVSRDADDRTIARSARRHAWRDARFLQGRRRQ